MRNDELIDGMKKADAEYAAKQSFPQIFLKTFTPRREQATRRTRSPRGAYALAGRSGLREGSTWREIKRGELPSYRS